MKEKLQQLMKSEGLTSSRMADILEIQPSGISHILSGRNKPGFDLLQKILRRFPRVNPDWLLLDSPQMYREDLGQAPPSSLSLMADDNLFGNIDGLISENEVLKTGDILQQSTEGSQRNVSPEDIQTLTNTHNSSQSRVSQVILVYEDHSFEALNMRKI